MMPPPETITPALSHKEIVIERVPPHPDVQRLHDIFQVNNGLDNVMLAARVDIRQVFTRIRDTYIDPRQQKAIEVLWDECDYALFATPGSELPSSLVLSQRSWGGRHIERRPDLDMEMPDDNDEYVFFQTVLKPAGLDAVQDSIVEEIEQRKLPIIAELRSWIIDQPEYQFLASFDAKSPRPKQQPLTTHWRQVRERQLEDEIRRKHGLEASGPLHHDHLALDALRRAVYHLDDETMPRHRRLNTGDSFTKLRAFFTNNIDESLTDIRRREQSDPELFDVKPGETNYPAGPWEVVTDEDGDVVIVLSNNCEYFAEEIVDHDKFAGTNRRHYGYDISISGLYDDAFEILFKQALAFNNFQDFLEVVTTSFATKLYKNKLDSLCNSLTSGRIDNYAGAQGHLPSAEVIDYDQAREWRRQIYDLNNRQSRGWRDTMSLRRRQHPEISLTSRDEMERQARRTVGTIIKTPSTMSTVSRVFDHGDIPADLPPVDPFAPQQLLIRMDDFLPYTQGHNAPIIPGFVLVGKNRAGDTHLAYQQTDSDPYQPALIPLGSRQAKLIHAYSAMGLQTLAVKLNSMTGATVQDLADAIHASAVYQMPENDDGFPDRLITPIVLEGFAPLVRNGRLHVQCDGANAFLRQSIESIFGPGTAVEHSGYVLNPRAPRISGALHAQTIFVHGGKTYILDATPAGQPIMGLQGGVRRVSNQASASYSQQTIGQQAPKQPAPPILQLASDIEVPKSILSSDLAASHQEHGLQQLVGQLESQLSIIFETPNRRALYKALVKLPEHDPARSSLRLIKRVASGEVISVEEIDRHQQYIENIRQAAPSLRRQLHVEGYDETVLTSLISTVDALRRLVSAS